MCLSRIRYTEITLMKIYKKAYPQRIGIDSFSRGFL